MEPGITLPGGMVTLPVNWDPFTNIVITLMNSPVFSGFMGNLNASGQAAAQMNLSALPSGTARARAVFRLRPEQSLRLRVQSRGD